MAFFSSFACPFDDKLSVIIEDNDSVAYAYLSEGGQIIADVWLYNSAETPEVVDWSNQNALPFMNRLEYIRRDKAAVRIISDEQLHFDWQAEPAQAVGIFIGDDLWAILSAGAMPGWSVLASKSGPLAHPLASYPAQGE